MSDADWTMINIEATLRKHKSYGYMGYPQFCTPHSILNDLKAFFRTYQTLDASCLEE